MQGEKLDLTEVYRHPDSGNHGSVTALSSYQESNCRYYREYSHQVKINGETEQAYGTACRQSDGSWQIKSLSLAKEFDPVCFLMMP
jgi:surface antigen